MTGLGRLDVTRRVAAALRLGHGAGQRWPAHSATQPLPYLTNSKWPLGLLVERPGEAPASQTEIDFVADIASISSALTAS